MLSVVEDLTLTELISESKNYQRYDLDATDGIDLKCWAKDELKLNSPSAKQRILSTTPL